MWNGKRLKQLTQHRSEVRLCDAQLPILARRLRHDETDVAGAAVRRANVLKLQLIK